MRKKIKDMTREERREWIIQTRRAIHLKKRRDAVSFESNLTVSGPTARAIHEKDQDLMNDIYEMLYEMERANEEI